ncbi:hypothetical protein [Azoarcus sp. DN11]|uniref:hypothetical protein n=1 Tax=Azoarcus sp. DN11 TaxID=356837 RepID=UPI000EAEE03A|nr:hypothetical protein [Azoarcus sp. DN11]AYH41801.1 hypothetical protein CDA09_00100 [Azoarcus sp. DN11]
MKSVIRAIAVLLAATSPGGGAAAADIDTVWACRYNGSMSIYCGLTAAPVPVTAPEQALAPAGPTDGFPTRGPLPPLVRTIAEEPGLLVGKLIRIPLYSLPEDLDDAALLADAVMCGARLRCRVIFDQGPTAPAVP